MVATSDRDGVVFALSAGNCGDAPEGRALLRQLGPVDHPVYLLMDRAYEGDETRALAVELGYTPVVPPKSNRKNPWDYDKKLYKQRNQVERLFRRIKHFRRIFTRYDKLDIVFSAFVHFALIIDALM
jgi:transposase